MCLTVVAVYIRTIMRLLLNREIWRTPKAYAGPSHNCKRALFKTRLAYQACDPSAQTSELRWIFYVLHVPGWCASALRGRLKHPKSPYNSA